MCFSWKIPRFDLKHIVLVVESTQIFDTIKSLYHTIKYNVDVEIKKNNKFKMNDSWHRIESK